MSGLRVISITLCELLLMIRRAEELYLFRSRSSSTLNGTDAILGRFSVVSLYCRDQDMKGETDLWKCFVRKIFWTPAEIFIHGWATAAKLLVSDD